MSSTTWGQHITLTSSSTLVQVVLEAMTAPHHDPNVLSSNTMRMGPGDTPELAAAAAASVQPVALFTGVFALSVIPSPDLAQVEVRITMHEGTHNTQHKQQLLHNKLLQLW